MSTPELTVSSPDDGSRSRQSTIQIGLAAGAAALTVLLTSTAFWLSFESLHDLAAAHRLHGERAWAWPACVDAFIAVGELLILRASLAKTVDRWAIGLTATGSIGSIALNVAGVGVSHDPLDYVTAAVPPVAALLAFGVLMRQIHEAIVARQHVEDILQEPVTAPQMATQDVIVPEVEETAPALQDKPSVTPTTEPVIESEQPVRELTQRELIDATVRALYDSLGGCRPATRHMVAALRDAGLPHSDGSCRTARQRVEQAEPALRDLPDALAV
jgi:hypothetical protein